MLQPIQGLVLRTTKYTDNSSIVAIYTLQYGLQTYIIRGIHRRTSSVKANYFRGLNLLDFIASKSPKPRLETIREVTGARSFNAGTNPIKNALFVYINELLTKTLKEETANQTLFGFMVKTLEILELKEGGCANFHLVFMLNYARYLGFYPTANYTNDTPYFALIEGQFMAARPLHNQYIEAPYSKLLFELMEANFATCDEVHITYAQRKQLLQAMISYYRLHHHLSDNLTSVSVLEQL